MNYECRDCKGRDRKLWLDMSRSSALRCLACLTPDYPLPCESMRTSDSTWRTASVFCFPSLIPAVPCSDPSVPNKFPTSTYRGFWSVRETFPPATDDWDKWFDLPLKPKKVFSLAELWISGKV
jgi:hypothetical protein